MHPMLNIAVRAARKAGTVINRASFDVDSLRTERKQHNDFVTEVDRAAEAAIIEVIKTAYPDHAILAEESGQSWADGETASENVWVIDPLDGTTNFIHGFPQYGVSIALMQRGVVTQAVVYDPTRDELFTASKGAGAFLNNRRIRVTRRDKLADCLIGTGFPYRDLEGLYDYTRLFATMTENCAGLRRPGRCRAGPRLRRLRPPRRLLRARPEQVGHGRRLAARDGIGWPGGQLHRRIGLSGPR